MNTAKPEPLRIAWIKTEPCVNCSRENGVCARPPGVVQSGAPTCDKCGHLSVCHVW